MTSLREESFTDEQLRAVARKRAKARRDLSAAVVLFVLVNAFLWLAWALTAGPSVSLAASPVWVTFGWGAIVALNAWSVRHSTVSDADIARELRALRRGRRPSR
jgi:hypothetical protein